MTLDAFTIDAVKRHLARGLNYRQTARQLRGRVSRGAVREIAQGLMRHDPARPPKKYNVAPIADVTKCPTCHYRVTMPCKICAARAWRHIRNLRHLRRLALHK
jgi:hypothetical protein